MIGLYLIILSYVLANIILELFDLKKNNKENYIYLSKIIILLIRDKYLSLIDFLIEDLEH